jgi:predicted histone-like DNA-binding protein
MAQGYKLIVRKVSDLKGGAKKDKVFAIAKYNGSTDIYAISKMIEARSAISSADVKAVIDNLNFVLEMELAAGRIVYLGELGTFRLTLRSTGAETKEKFSNANVKKARLHFTPGTVLRKACQTASFSSLESKQKAEGGTTGDTTGGNTGGGTDEKPSGL